MGANTRGLRTREGPGCPGAMQRSTAVASRVISRELPVVARQTRAAYLLIELRACDGELMYTATQISPTFIIAAPTWSPSCHQCTNLATGLLTSAIVVCFASQMHLHAHSSTWIKCSDRSNCQHFVRALG